MAGTLHQGHPSEDGTFFRCGAQEIHAEHIGLDLADQEPAVDSGEDPYLLSADLEQPLSELDLELQGEPGGECGQL